MNSTGKVSPQSWNHCQFPLFCAGTVLSPLTELHTDACAAWSWHAGCSFTEFLHKPLKLRGAPWDFHTSKAINFSKVDNHGINYTCLYLQKYNHKALCVFMSPWLWMQFNIEEGSFLRHLVTLEVNDTNAWIMSLRQQSPVCPNRKKHCSTKDQQKNRFNVTVLLWLLCFKRQLMVCLHLGKKKICWNNTQE